MPEFDDISEVFTAVFVILIISVIVAFAWLSTYVQEQPIVATAVVVIHQDSPQASSLETPSNQIPETVSTNNSVANNSMSSPDQAQNSSNIEENKDLQNIQAKRDVSENKQSCKDEVNLQDEDSILNSTRNINSDNEVDRNTSDLCPDSETLEIDSSNGSLIRQRTHNINSNSDNENSEVNMIENEPSSEIGSHCEDLTQEYIRIKLKFLDDTHRLVRGQLTDEVGTFKRANFSLELSSNQIVRLIFNGRLLNRDNSTLGQYGLFDNCVVHCHVSQSQASNSNERSTNVSNAETDGLDLSEMLSPILVVIIAFLWYLRFSYSHIFNTSSTIVLIFLTALLLISQYALTFSLNISFGLREGNGSNNGDRSNGNSIRSRSLLTRDDSPNDFHSGIQSIGEQVSPVSTASTSLPSTSTSNTCREGTNDFTDFKKFYRLKNTSTFCDAPNENVSYLKLDAASTTTNVYNTNTSELILSA